MFVDKIVIQLRAGKGGNGVIAWRREKFLPKGGPSGGNGGQGGSIIIEADHDTYSLEDFRNSSIIKADDGNQGEGGNRQGRTGEDLVLKVPLGTLLKDASNDSLIYDFTLDKERFVICEGGKGGKGNNFFKSSRNRTPTKRTLGLSGEEKKIELELKLIADVGFVGFPNAGKSSLFSVLTNVPQKIGAYPFTTIRPSLGFIEEENKRIYFADIPGIIKGANQDKGLGLSFLRHIERTSLLLFVIDVSGSDDRNPCEDYQTLREELFLYNPDLLKKPYVVALNKIDAAPEENIHAFKEQFPEEVILISAKTGIGIEELIEKVKGRLSFRQG